MQSSFRKLIRFNFSFSQMFRLTQGACPHHLPQTPPTTLSAHIATGGADLDFPPFSYLLLFSGFLRMWRSDTYQSVKTFAATKNVDMYRC